MALEVRVVATPQGASGSEWLGRDLWEHGGGGQAGTGNVPYLDPHASCLGFQIRENPITVHLRFLLFIRLKLY